MLRQATLAVLFSAATLPAMAGGAYLNPEFNRAYVGDDSVGSTLDLHIGYEGGTEDGKVAYYVQGGPGFVHTESSDDTETEISGKVGVSVQVADAASVYGEISGISNEDSSGDDIIDFGGKLGVKYVF